VDDAEHRRRRADAKRERQDGHDGDAAHSEDCPEGEAKIAQGVVHQRDDVAEGPDVIIRTEDRACRYRLNR
jgi:hypothetical protein